MSTTDQAIGAGHDDVNSQRARLADLLQRFRRCSSATSADRTARSLLLDDLQDVVGLNGQMTTERDILRRADAMLNQA